MPIISTLQVYDSVRAGIVASKIQRHPHQIWVQADCRTPHGSTATVKQKRASALKKISGGTAALPVDASNSEDASPHNNTIRTTVDREFQF